MNKIIYPLHRCPWCKRLPEVEFYFECQTWMPKIVCKHVHCKMNPESKPVYIRKTCKIDLETLKKKMKDLFDSWNEWNPTSATEGKEIDFDEIIEQGMKEERKKI